MRLHGGFRGLCESTAPAGRAGDGRQHGLGSSSSCTSKTGDHILPSMLVFSDSSLHLCSVSETLRKIPITLRTVAQLRERETLAKGEAEVGVLWVREHPSVLKMD